MDISIKGSVEKLSDECQRIYNIQNLFHDTWIISCLTFSPLRGAGRGGVAVFFNTSLSEYFTWNSAYVQPLSVIKVEYIAQYLLVAKISFAELGTPHTKFFFNSLYFTILSPFQNYNGWVSKSISATFYLATHGTGIEGRGKTF